VVGGCGARGAFDERLQQPRLTAAARRRPDHAFDGATVSARAGAHSYPSAATRVAAGDSGRTAQDRAGADSARATDNEAAPCSPRIRLAAATLLRFRGDSPRVDRSG
jgi:hypothetical protein